MTELHPLVSRLIERDGAMPVTAGTLDAVLARPGAQAILFGGDPVRFPECLDVAVVLPELQRASGGAFGTAVVLRDDEDACARRFGVRKWPSLVFVRDGGWLATLPGIRDWDAYVADVADALRAPVSRPPTVGIPVVGADARDTDCTA